MLASVQQYNALNGVIIREDLQGLATNLQKDEQLHLANKLTSLLANNETVKKFDIESVAPEFQELPKSLRGAVELDTYLENEHTGLNKPAGQEKIYDMVTDKLIEAIETTGGLPWYKGYDDDKGAENGFIAFDSPMNFKTQKAYRGVNGFMLSFYPQFTGYTDGFGGKKVKTGKLVPITDERLYWLTAKQIKAAKGTIKTDSIAQKAIFFNFIFSHKGKPIKEVEYNKLAKKYGCSFKNKSKECSELRKSAYLTYYNVFNERDIKGIDFDKIRKENADKKATFFNDQEKIEAAEQVIKNFNDAPAIKQKHIGKGESPFYRGGKIDAVTMPFKQQFDNVADWYGILFHEYIHATGHEKRLNRDSLRDYGKAKSTRAFEELIAEIGSMFLNAQTGILFHTLKQNAVYIKGWNNSVLASLKEDNKAIFKAASAAQKAADFILQPDKNGLPKFLKGLETAQEKAKKEDKTPKPPVVTRTKRAKKKLVKVDDNGQYGLFGAAPNKKFKTIKEFCEVTYAWAKKNLVGKKYFHPDIKKNVLFTNKGIDHCLGYKRSFLKTRMIYDAFDLLKQSKLIDFCPDTKKRKDINGVYRMGTQKTVEGIVYDVVLTLREGKNGVIYYDHKASKIKRAIPTSEVTRKSDVVAKSSLSSEEQNKDTKKGLKAAVIKQPALNFEVVETPIVDEPVNNIIPSSTPGPILETPVEIKKMVKQTTSKNPLVKNLSATKESSKNIERYNIDGDLSEFLGDLEIKPKDSLAITIDAEQGAGKTRLVFQMLNKFAGSGYRCLFASLEEHPESSLFNEKVQEYINPANEPLIDSIGELPNGFKTLKGLIPDYDIVFIDSWSKIAEEDRTVDFDKDLRKGFDSKLFVSIFQRTADGKMRGGSKAAFDGDVILKMEKAPDFRNSYVYANKNRYQNKPLDTLKYNTFTKSMVKDNEPTQTNNNQQQPTQLNYEVVG